MNILPNDTVLGRLSFFEIYDDFMGPKCFSVLDDLQQLYLVYWSGDYDGGASTKWVYMPVSRKILDELLREECSFNKVFSKSDRLSIVTTYQDKKTVFEALTDENKSSVNLPPLNFSIDFDEIQSVAPESNWNFNLRIAKQSGKGSPADEVITKVIDAFGNIIKFLMKDEHNKKPSITPLTAGYGSFDVKLGSNNQERAAVAIELLDSILADHNNIEEKLAEFEMDPYKLKDLLDIVNMDKIELTLKSKTSDILSKPLKINSTNLLPIIKKLETSTIPFIDSSKVPQANCLDRIVIIVKHRVDGGELKHDQIDGINSQRQVDYHTHAARCLGLLNYNKTVTSAGRLLAQKNTQKAQYQFLADRVESSDFCWAWMKWAGVSSLADIPTKSAQKFITECVKGLSRTSIPRRASSLDNWIDILKKYSRDYDEPSEKNKNSQ